MTKQAAIILSLLLLISGIIFTTVTVHAAGWLDYAQQTINLGTMVTDSIKTGDYYGPTEGNKDYYWHIYKFSMPQKGLLNIYIESESENYFDFANAYSWQGYVIFSASNPDDIVWRCKRGENQIEKQFSASRSMYYGSTEIALNQGEYYFAIRQKQTCDTPYYLTLSYKEPIVNVTSITLNPSRMTLETGDQRSITATVLPDNATDKTILWKSSNPSVAAVDNGTVTAVSKGNASIVATSIDGEISATCAVTVSCNHNYQTSVSPATTESDGSIAEVCTKCGDRKDQIICRINGINLSKTSYTYDGKVKNPSVSIADSQGKVLEDGRDYKVSYPSGSERIGIYKVSIEFIGNYHGTVEKQFKIIPKPTSFTKVTPKRKDITLKWKKASAGCGYEIAYSPNKKFSKKNTYTVDVKNNKTVSKTIRQLKPKQKYYVRIRTYKNVSINGKTTKLCSSWSKIKTVTTKK